MASREIGVGLLAFALVLVWASAAGAATRPKLTVAVKPAVAAPGATVAVSGRVTGRLRGSRRSLRVVLEERIGARWARRAAVKPSRKLKFVVRWRVPSAAGVRTLRLRLLRGRRALASSARWRLTVAAPSLPGAGPPAPSPAPAPAPAPGGGSGPGAPAAQTLVIAPSTVEAAPAAGSAGVLRLAGDVVVRAGDVLASGIGDAGPYGFLFKATGARSEGGDTVVDVVPATLLEAIPQGRIDESLTFAPASGVQRAADGSGSGTRFRETLACTTGGTVTIEGSADLGGPALNLNADWGFLKLNSVEATASVTASAHASASATGSASCTVGPIKIFETKLAPVTFTVGAVPVVLVPEIEIELDGLGQIDAAVAASVDASLTAKAGAKYQDGDLSPISELQESFNHQPPDPQAAAKLTATLSSELEIAAYGVGGPAFNFNAGLEANADPEAADPWWTLDAPISFTAGLDIDILDIEAGPITVYEKTFRLAEAAPEAFTWSGTVSVSEDLRAPGFIYADPERPQLEDAIAGSFSMGVAGQPGVELVPGVEQIQAATSDGSIALTPTHYPMFVENDPDCTWSRSWENVGFNELAGMLEIATFTEDLETGVRDHTRGSVRLFRAEGQVDERGFGFGYDYSETQGRDATCDTAGKSTESHFFEVLSTRDFGVRARSVPVVRDAEGRIFMQTTVTQDVPSEGQGRDLYPLTAFGHGTRTITVDLLGLPPGVPAP